jgi:2-(1,2-epoxy-1,2-dihydrophenyl)acetyl-CoA isomerase
MSQLVLSETRNGILTLTLNRPERHNSLVPELLRDLLDALDWREPPELRAAILQANGRSFSTGGDVQAFCDHWDDIAAYANQVVGLLNQVILALIALPVPIVTAVHGIVTGGSLGFVLASDIVLVAPEASFTPYYAVVGYSPDGGWTAMLPSVIGHQRAAEILALNRTITAEQAVAWGIANRIVPADQIRDAARATAEAIARHKPGSVWRTKPLLWGDIGQIARRLDAERQQFVEHIVSAEARAGMAAFLGRG